MLQLRSILKSADNTGVLKLMIISGGIKKRFTIGEVVTCTVKKSVPHSEFKKGEMVKVLIVRTRKEKKRPDGSYIRFDDNAGVIVDPKTKVPKGTRILGPIAREIKELGYDKIASLAKEIY